MEILVAKTAGFCFGVRRALELVQDALGKQASQKGEILYSIGPLIHNPRVVNELSEKGVQTVFDIEAIPQASGKVVIRSHGAGPGIYQKAAGRNLEIIDATCPFVKNVQKLGAFLADQGYQVIIFGEREHAEVKGVLESIGIPALVLNDSGDLNEDEPISSKVGVISQTTQETAKLSRLVAQILPYTKEIRVFNTICSATSERQQEAAALSRQVDLMIVVGGRNSANTFRLVEICRNNGTTTYQVESAAEINPDWFQGINKTGITAGASTPDQQIAEIVEKINAQTRDLGGQILMAEKINPGVPQVEPFDAETEAAGESMNLDWPEDRFRELTEGQVIDARVILVRDDAAFVDIGGKSDLTIPVEELATQPAISARELVKVGDIIKVMVTRTGEEDKIRLSKRLVDQQRIWFDLEETFQKGTPVSGKVLEVLKGGLNVEIEGLKAFMPASQATLSFTKNLNELIGKEFPVKILEFDRFQHRIVVSRRELLESEKKRVSAEFYATIQEGERRTGKVTRIADFGAFVDLGAGIEGLIHISELSWYRVKSVKEALNEGDQVEVMVIKVNPTAQRISLSLKQIQSHPWDEAALKFKEGEIYSGTVVRLETFGAFVRLAPGVDGLVHISQISDTRINKPSEVLKVGDEVRAKILKIDTANRKISLSLREACEDRKPEETAQLPDTQNEATAFTQNLGDFLKINHNKP
jgi:4-hydroxy-3-methylbut-2-enyl diphosphate reductase